MKIIKRILALILIIATIINISSISLADHENNGVSTLSVELSKEFEDWESLSEEERKNTIMPSAFSSTLTQKDQNKANSMLFGIQNALAKATIPSKYSLTEDINVPIKHQGDTMECWAFSMTSVLESFLAKTGQKDVIPRYSERHMDYATSKTFADGINPIGYNREVVTGGNYTISLGYLTNGTGAVLEEDMPFENNTNKINLSEINKEPQIRVTDYKIFPNINKEINTTTGDVKYLDDSNNEYTDEEVTLIRNEIKQYIMKYGAISATTYGGGYQYYTNPFDPMHSAAYYCDEDHVIDHAVTIVGWDDNYSVDNFNPARKPKNPGAYICLNSYGEESFDKGYTYISYDDVNIEVGLAGITGAEDITSDQTIYQHDFYGQTANLNINPGGDVGIASVYTKESQKDEYIEEVQVGLTGNVSIEVYVNPNDDSLDASKLEKVDVDDNKLEYNETTLKLKNPVKINGDKFAVVVRIKSTEKYKLGVECNLYDSGLSFFPTIFDCVVANPGENFISTNSLQSWEDFTNLKVSNADFKSSNLCLKAITTTKSTGSNPDTNSGNENTNTNTGNENTNTNTGNENTNTNTGNENTNTNTGNENTNTNTGNENTNTNTGNENTNTNTGNENTNTNTGNENTNTNTGNENTNTNTGNENTNTNTGNENTNTNTGNENTNTNTGNENTNTNTGNENTNTNTGNENTNTNTGNENTNTNTGNENTNTNTGNENKNTNNNNYNGGTGTTNSGSGNNSAYYYNGTVDKSLSDALLPKTGVGIIGRILPIVFIVFIISYVNYRKYKDIK